MAIVDAHVHIFPAEVASRPRESFAGEACFELLYGRAGAALATADQLLAAMESSQVAVAVVCGFPWRDPSRARDHNQLILEAARAHPGKLVPLAAIDPLADGALGEAEWALAAGAAGLGEIGAYLDDLGDLRVKRSLQALASLCAEADRPLLLHTNEPVGHDYPGKAPMGLSGLYELLRACPATRFQLAHLGGGIFFYELLR
ncbi:MAG: amidohydrolase, partial [Deltaproteobacteria bacterium]|nr:amidohydrolase [Deltaproteobacteria bacterium]